MILITGGMAQGKRVFASDMGRTGMYGWEKLSGVCENGQEFWTDGSWASWETFVNAPLCCDLHQFIRRWMRGDLSVKVPASYEYGSLKEPEESFSHLLITSCPDRILITDDIGCGIVPLEPFERLWRERTGRICCRLAAEAEQVWRVSCGIGQRIK